MLRQQHIQQITQLVMNTNHRKQNLEPLDLAEDNTAHSKVMNTQNRQDIILYQYKMLQMYGPLLGVYAIPNLNNFNTWNCIMFIRKGFYKDAKFKLDLILPLKFPIQAPQIIFKSKVFHPLVQQTNGAVDIQNLLCEKWNYSNENMLYSVFSGLNKMFIQKSKFEIQSSFNPEAAKLFLNKPQIFIERALNSVEDSLDNLYVNQAGTSLIINQYQNGQLDLFKDKLESLCQQNKAPEEKRKKFMQFVLKE